MNRTTAFTAFTALTALSSGCATMRSVAALRQVEFAIDTVVNVNLAGVNLDRVRSVSDISNADAVRIAASTLRQNVPLSFTIHVRGLNPAENNTTARMMRFTWTLLLNNKQTVSGSVDSAYTFVPGTPTIVNIPVSFNVYDFFANNARTAMDLAVGLAGGATQPTDVALTATPIIDTPLGAITYPHAITIVKRTIGQSAPTNP